MRAVLLDCFGTLVALQPPAPRLREGLLEFAGVEVTEQAAAAAFRAEIGYYVAHHLEGRDAASLDALRDACAQVIRASLAVPGLALAPVRAAMLGALRFSAYPDAAPALRALRGSGRRIVVASNWDCSLGEVLRSVGLAPLVDGVVSSAEVGESKPAPALLLRAVELAGVSPAEAVHVGDSYADDVLGAQAAGVRALLLDRPAVGPYGASRSRAAPTGPAERITSLEQVLSVTWVDGPRAG